MLYDIWYHMAVISIDLLVHPWHGAALAAALWGWLVYGLVRR